MPRFLSSWSQRAVCHAQGHAGSTQIRILGTPASSVSVIGRHPLPG